MLHKVRHGKYNNKHVKLNGITFDSIVEAARYVVLVAQQNDGRIELLRVHPKYTFACGGTYSPDFSYRLMNLCKPTVVEDVKSQPTKTQIYRRNKAMMLDEFGIDVREITMDKKTAAALVAGYASQKGS